jgi:hypothetical protein
LSPEAVRRAVREVLTDAAYRANAARLRDEASGLPGLEHGIALLERLAAEKTPLVAASYSHSPDRYDGGDIDDGLRAFFGRSE